MQLHANLADVRLFDALVYFTEVVRTIIRGIEVGSYYYISRH